MKLSNFGPAPRTLSDATFHAWGCAIERPAPRSVSLWNLSKWAGWCGFALLALVLIAGRV